MIRSEELLDKLIANLHFHHYLEITGSDIMGQGRNVIATKPKIDVINRYIDDVFIDFFFRSHHFEPIIIPKNFYSKKYTNEGLLPVKDEISLNLNNLYDRFTFVHIVNLLFSNNRPPLQGISPNNSFLAGFLMEEKVIAPYCRCNTPIMEMPHTEILDQYLDCLYGNRHSLFNPVFRAEAVRDFGLHYQKNWINYTMGNTSYGMRVLHNRAKDYKKIKNSHVFGYYSIEDLLFLYSILAEKVQLQEDNVLSYISLYCESFYDDNNIINQFDKFEKEHTTCRVIEPFISIEDLYLRFTSTSKSKAFTFTPVDYQIVEIRQFQNKKIRAIFNDNPLPLPYYYDEIEKSPFCLYVVIVDCGECFSTTMEFINGVYANKTEWEKHNFYPQNDMVGEVVKVTPRAYIVKIKEGIYVPMTKNGIREIAYNEYVAGIDKYVCSGMDNRQQIINDGLDSLVGNSWQHLPDLRGYFRQDIIENMKRLTCDYEVNIFLPDLEQSCVIYATDMILEYKKLWGSTLPPYVIDELSNQVMDVYREFFSTQFLEESINRCKKRIKILVNCSDAQEQIDNYYQKVNMRYAMR